MLQCAMRPPWSSDWLIIILLERYFSAFVFVTLCSHKLFCLSHTKLVFALKIQNFDFTKSQKDLYFSLQNQVDILQRENRLPRFLLQKQRLKTLCYCAPPKVECLFCFGTKVVSLSHLLFMMTLQSRWTFSGPVLVLHYRLTANDFWGTVHPNSSFLFLLYSF